MVEKISCWELRIRALIGGFVIGLLFGVALVKIGIV